MVIRTNVQELSDLVLTAVVMLYYLLESEHTLYHYLVSLAIR